MKNYSGGRIRGRGRGHYSLNNDPRAAQAFLEGDSITSQSTTGSTVFNSIGYINAINAVSYNRFPYLIGENYGVGGGTLDTMNTDKTSLAGATGKILFFMGGTNDVGVATPNLATMQSNFTSIKNYVLGTLGKWMVAFTILPRTQDLGVPLTGLQLTALLGFNTWLKAQHNPSAGFFVVDGYAALCSALDTPNPAYFKDETGKLLHPNPAGAIQLGKTAWTQLQSFGFISGSRPSNTAGNIFTFGAMTGSGGTASTNASGTVATGLTVSGSGGTQSRVCSVIATGQRVVWSPISGDGAAANVRVAATSNITTGYSIGDTVYGWAEVLINNALRMDGPYMQLTENGTPSTAYIGFNKAGATTGFMPSDAGTLFMVTPRFVIPATNTSLKPEVICQAECAANAGIVDFTVLGMGIAKV
jgi:hypothetical protein